MKESLDGHAKDATEVTRQSLRSYSDLVASEDVSDHERVEYGRLSPSSGMRLESDSGQVIVDSTEFSFLDGDAPATVNPSLWRQSKLTNHQGLYQLAPRLYQVRGYDIANLSLVEGETGWIVIDPLTTTETARAAMDLVEMTLGAREVSAVIYTHCHRDHYGGMEGVASRDYLARNDVPIIAPKGFMEEATAESVVNGSVWSRRRSYHAGASLPKNERGNVGVGLGLWAPLSGNASLIPPTVLIETTGQELTVDGVDIVFQYTPDTEAPAEMMFYFHQLKALCTAENCTSTMHNLYTLRGAQIRDGLAWSKYIQEALLLFGDEVEILFASHHWPRIGNEDIRHFLQCQRDTYRYIHDQTMRRANHGETPLEIAEDLELPETLQHEFGNRGYYGSVSHNAKAVYQRYVGWFDGNPANLNPLPPVEAAQNYLDYMGGSESVIAQARESFDRGEYRWVAQVMNHVVFAEPVNVEARELQADALEQLGYQAESASWRNFYLTGAQELRSGRPEAAGLSTYQQRKLLAQLTSEMLFDWIGIRFNPSKFSLPRVSLEIEFTDIEERWVVSIENSALNSHEGRAADTDACLSLTRPQIHDLLVGEMDLSAVLNEDGVTCQGSRDAVEAFIVSLDHFDGMFNIVEP